MVETQCQENSNARQGTGLESPSLGGEFIRVINALRPQFVLRENPSRVRADAPWPWWRFRSALESIGYSVLPFRVRACCVGADHQRDRLFLLAELSDAMQARSQRTKLEEMAGQNAERFGSQGIRNAPRLNRWIATPRICRSADGVSSRIQRTKALGNAVVPQVAEYIGRCIVEAHQASEPPCQS